MNGKVICNTGPIVALSMIDRIDILRHLFELVAIPEAVHKEILEGGPINAGLLNYRKAEWIKVVTLSKPVDPLLRTSLDSGEAAPYCRSESTWLGHDGPQRLSGSYGDRLPHI